MIIITVYHGTHIFEERLADSDEQYVDPLVDALYAAGANEVYIDQVNWESDYTFTIK